MVYIIFDPAWTVTRDSFPFPFLSAVLAQTSLPIVLNSLLGCLLAIQAYCESSAYFGTAFGEGAPAKWSDHHVMRPQPFAVTHALETAIYRVLLTFNQHLGEFSFPPLHAAKLRAFMELAV